MVKEENERHLLVFSAEWCGPCRMMKSHVWDDPDVKARLETFSSVNFIDIDDPETRKIAQAYKIQAVPTIYIVDESGVPIKAGNTMDINGTLNFLG
jgi:thioredoxin 1